MLLWTVYGILLGWIADVLFCTAPSRAAQVFRPPAQATGLQTTARAALCVLAIAAILLAAAQTFDWLPAWFYELKGFLLSVEMQTLIVAFLAGWWASHNRHHIAARTREFYRALLGTGGKSPWALQSIAAIVVLSGLVLVLKPDLLDKIESIKAGQVEAKFSIVSTVTRESARASLNEVAKDITIGQWIDFKAKFRQGAREDVLYLDKSKIGSLRKEIRNRLFEHYIEPITILLACLEKDRRLDEIAKSEKLTAMAISLRNAIIHEAKDTESVGISDKATWTGIVDLMNQEIVELSHAIEIQIPPETQATCEKYTSAQPATSPQTATSAQPVSYARKLVTA
jgi:hypothetical protein